MLILAALLACVTSAPADKTGSPTDIDSAGDDSGTTDSGGGNDTGTGGALTYESFLSAMPEILCTTYDTCFSLAEMGFDSMEECIDTFGAQLTTELGECPNFDAVAAQACMDVFTTATCEELTSAESPTAVCETVCGQSAEPS
jgi:hypothetical protein